MLWGCIVEPHERKPSNFYYASAAEGIVFCLLRNPFWWGPDELLVLGGHIGDDDVFNTFLDLTMGQTVHKRFICIDSFYFHSKPRELDILIMSSVHINKLQSTSMEITWRAIGHLQGE